MKATNATRAIWMVLITSLAGPFIVAFAVAAIGLVHQILDLGLLPFGDATVGDIAVRVFLWASFPATIAALALVPFVLQSGTYSWLHAAVAGVIGCGLAAVIFPIAHGSVMPLLAFAAGLTGVGMRALLIRGGILKP